MNYNELTAGLRVRNAFGNGHLMLAILLAAITILKCSSYKDNVIQLRKEHLCAESGESELTAEWDCASTTSLATMGECHMTVNDSLRY